MNCIACRKPLADVDDRANQPHGGLEFITYGHYGSTFFDPMDGSKLAINVCDDCLRAAAKAGNVITNAP